MVRTTEVPDLAFNHAVTIHILILHKIFRLQQCKNIIVNNLPSLTWPSSKGSRGEVNLLWEIGEQLMVETLHPVSVAALP